MSLAVVHSRAAVGVDAPEVTVEVHLANGLPSLSVVGLPETAVKESKDRVRSAIVNAGFEFPQRRVTVNLAPADLPKDGGRFDLPIALGILAASRQLPAPALEHYEFIGELALTGALRPVSGVLASAARASRTERELVVPAANGSEAALVRSLRAHAADSLLAVCRHLRGSESLPAAECRPMGEPPTYPDLNEVKGQHQAKRCLEIAAAGAHSLLFIGPPGTGKTMLASRLPGILPPMSDDEALAAATVQSVARHGFEPADWAWRPFRAPHHSASQAALVGGGSRPMPGEASLAHHGVLFLDELPEFSRQALEALREPLETGEVTISRAAAQVAYPARFQLVAAMNPCPCGYLADPSGGCRCSPDQVTRYRGKLSGPLLDRLDLMVEVPRLPADQLHGRESVESSAEVRARVVAARARQQARRGRPNAALAPRQIEADAALGQRERTLMEQATQRLCLSARAYHRVLKLARTIADLAGSETVTHSHLSEALSCRRADPARQSV